MIRIVEYAPLIALLLYAAAVDIRERRVPNWISMGLTISGLGLSCSSWGHISPSQALLGSSVGFAIALLLHLIGGIGAGDVKLVAAVGAWIGAVAVLIAFAGAAMIGMFIAIAMSIRQGRLKDLMRQSVMLGARISGGTHGIVARPRQAMPPELMRRRTLPFAAAIAIATVGVIVVTHIGTAFEMAWR